MMIIARLRSPETSTLEQSCKARERDDIDSDKTARQEGLDYRKQYSQPDLNIPGARALKKAETLKIKAIERMRQEASSYT